MKSTTFEKIKVTYKEGFTTPINNINNETNEH